MPSLPPRRGQSRLGIALLVVLFMLQIVPATASESGHFVDDGDSIFEADIDWLADNDLTSGCNADGTEFCPDDYVTRGELAAFFRRALSEYAPAADGKASFVDTAQSIFVEDIDWLAGTGITRGCTEDGSEFCPDDYVTRGQIAAFFRRALQHQLGGGDGAKFTDVAGNVFVDDIGWLSAVGITRGCADGRFCPTRHVTRGELAAMLRRAILALMGEEEGKTWYADTDGDGFGDATHTTVAAEQPAGYVADGTDCNDADASIHPGANETVGDGIDQNCDGVDSTVWHADADGDLFGDAAVTAIAAEQPVGYVADSTDCDDTNATVYPGATEIADDGIDQDCDGVDSNLWHADADGDLFGDAAVTAVAAEQPAGYVADSTDCDDTDATVYPGGKEIANDGIDQDCDGADLVAQMERVSVADDGTEGNHASYVPSISADGRFVAFYSNASNLVAGDTNALWDVFVVDRDLDTIERVSVGGDGTEANNGSYQPSISADGRFVTFYSNATNLVAGDTNAQSDVFVVDRDLDTIERVSVAGDGTEGNGQSYIPSISADGRFVTFYSWASNLVAGDTNGQYDVFVVDRDLDTIERVSVADDGTEGDSASLRPSISADGRFVTFDSAATNLVAGDTNGQWDIFVVDRDLDTIERVSVADDGGESDRTSHWPQLSADGRFVTFGSFATNLVAGDTNGQWDVFVIRIS